MTAGFQPCPNQAANKKQCTCSYTGCARHGVCCKCVQYHLGQGERPQCFVKAGV